MNNHRPRLLLAHHVHTRLVNRMVTTNTTVIDTTAARHTRHLLSICPHRLLLVTCSQRAWWCAMRCMHKRNEEGSCLPQAIQGSPTPSWNWAYPVRCCAVPSHRYHTTAPLSLLTPTHIPWYKVVDNDTSQHEVADHFHLLAALWAGYLPR